MQPFVFDAKLVYIHSSSPNYIRVSKMLPLFSRLFREVHYIGCLRGDKWNSETALDNVFYHVADIRLQDGAKSIMGTIEFLKYIKSNLNNIQPEVVVATNEDFILPFAFGYFSRPKFLICDLIDSLAIRIGGTLRHLWPFWTLLSVWAKKNMDGMIEVNEERLARHTIKPKLQTIIYNSPQWKEITQEGEYGFPFIYVCGSIVDELSGVEALLEAVDQIPQLKIVFAGRCFGTWSNKIFLNHKKVINLGEITPDRSLAIAKSSKAMFAHYKPINPNFIYAAPNKLFDAMMLGIPLLINSECVASQLATKYGFGIITRYGDVHELKIALKKLMINDCKILDDCERAQKVFRSEYSWELMRGRCVTFFSELGVPLQGGNK